MFLTMYYMTATIFQSWRLKTICSKISKHLSSKASIVFYSIEETGNNLDYIKTKASIIVFFLYL